MVDNEMVINSNGGEFLKDFMSDLPDNVMFNKVITGCGMTSLVLSNRVKYVIAVPYISLIKNKINWCKKKRIDLLSVYSGGNDEDDIIVFTGNKIITTYDSLGLVTEALEKRGDLNEWKICIDEAHKLVDSASFRPRAIKNILNNYKRYKAFVFGSSTPIQEKHQLPALRGIRKFRIDWDANLMKPFQINYQRYPKRINDVVTVTAIKYLSGEIQENAHFFINSVKSIVAIMRKLIELGYSDHTKVKIVCASNSRNLKTIKDSLSDDYAISSINESPRNVNFYTSTAFEGCDIYDENGQSYIVVDGGMDYTKINVATILPQIVGRIRDSKYKNNVELIYSNNSLFTKVSEREFENVIKQHLKGAKTEVDILNQLDSNAPSRRKLMHDDDNIYIYYEDDKFILNENAMYNEMYNFRTIHHTYCTGKNGIKNGIKKYNGTEYVFTNSIPVDISHLTTNKSKPSSKPSFRKLVNAYHKFNEILKDDSASKKAKLEKFKAHVMIPYLDSSYPLVREAMQTLGFDKISKLDFRKSDVKKELLIRNALISSNSKIVSLLKLKTGNWISRTDAKQKIQTIYYDLAINKTAKATDLNEWYTTKECSSYINGKKTTGFTIITCNIKKEA